MTKAVVTPTGQVNVEMTPQEVSEKQSAEAAWIIERDRRDATRTRQASLAEKWPDAFDLLDDILNRGIEAVKSDRDAIKSANPKGE